jgi:hypothetical protein
MKKKMLLFALLAIVAAVSFFSFIAVQKSKRSGGNKESKLQVCKTISSAELEASTRSTKAKSIRASIYPIKKSANMQQSDLDALVVLGETDQNPYQKMSVAQFEKQAGYYVDYLKKQKVVTSTLPYHYVLYLNREGIVQKLPICFCLDPLTGKIKTCDSESGQNNFVFENDSAGRCPPDCLASTPTLSRFDSIMQMVILKRK